MICKKKKGFFLFFIFLVRNKKQGSRLEQRRFFEKPHCEGFCLFVESMKKYRCLSQKNMRSYLDLVQRILDEGFDREDRTGTGTRGIFGAQLRFDISEKFPLLTTKKVFLKGVIYELLWLLKGETNIQYLKENGVHIWDEWADAQGNLGRVYGAQWRDWKTNDGKSIDQITRVIEEIKTNPNSRRLIINAWNVGELDKMALPPCHMFFQFFVADGKLSCQLYQRSADMFLGVPFNIASYSLLTLMMAQVCELQPGEFIHTFGDAHIYHNHFDQVHEQLTREPRELPTMKLNPNITDIFGFDFADFTLENYDPHPKISAPVAV